MPIIVNGLMEYAIFIDNGVDEFNRPFPDSIKWSKPIPCHIMTVTHRNDGWGAEGIFVQSSYKIWIESYGREITDTWKILATDDKYGLIELDDTNLMIDVYLNPISSPHKFFPERVRLTQDGVNIGEWQVQAPPQIKHSNGRIEIIVGNRLNRQI